MMIFNMFVMFMGSGLSTYPLPLFVYCYIIIAAVGGAVEWIAL